MDNKPKYGQQVLVLLLFFVGAFLVASCLQVVALMFGMDIQNINHLLVLQAVTQLIVFVVPPVLLAVVYKHNAKELFCLDFGVKHWLQALIAIVILVLTVPMIDWLTQWNDGWHFGGAFAAVEEALRSAGEAALELTAKLVAADNVGQLLANLVVIALVPAVCEELFFRGTLQQLMRKWVGNPHVAVIVTAVVFSLAHGEVFAFVPRFVLGALLGYLFYYSGSILVNIVAHFVNNATVVVAYYLSTQGVLGFSPDEPLNVMWQWTALFTVAGIGLLYSNFIMDHKESR